MYNYERCASIASDVVGTGTGIETRRARWAKIAQDAASRRMEEEKTVRGLNPALYHLPDMADECQKCRECLLRIKSGR